MHLAKERPWVVVLHLARNFGQHPATAAGILHTSGDWVVTLDEDLQHPPSKIPDLLRKAVEDQSDVVYGKAESQVHESAARDFGSRAYKQFLALVTGNQSIRIRQQFPPDTRSGGTGQEERLRGMRSTMRFLIYRPTSAYGYADARSRKGSSWS
jgi:glycosyltransferase involved in cell wall biosynthesis